MAKLNEVLTPEQQTELKNQDGSCQGGGTTGAAVMWETAWLTSEKHEKAPGLEEPGAFRFGPSRV